MVGVQVGDGVTVRVALAGGVVGVRVAVQVRVALGGMCVGVAVARSVMVGVAVAVGITAVTVSVIEGASKTTVGVGWRAVIRPTIPVARQSMPDSRLKTIDHTKSRQPR